MAFGGEPSNLYFPYDNLPRIGSFKKKTAETNVKGRKKIDAESRQYCT